MITLQMMQFTAVVLMLIFGVVGFLRPFGSKPAELERQIRPSGWGVFSAQSGLPPARSRCSPCETQ